MSAAECSEGKSRWPSSTQRVAHLDRWVAYLRDMALAPKTLDDTACQVTLARVQAAMAAP